MAISTGIRNLVLVGHCRADKSEGMASDIYVGDGLFDAGHVTGDALTACAFHFVMRVFGNGTYVRTVQRTWSMAFEADYIRWLD